MKQLTEEQMAKAIEAARKGGEKAEAAMRKKQSIDISLSPKYAVIGLVALVTAPLWLPCFVVYVILSAMGSGVCRTIRGDKIEARPSRALRSPPPPTKPPPKPPKPKG